jgi:ketopantoate reductase
VGGGAIGGITAALLDGDAVVLDANAEHAGALREPGLVINDEPPIPLDAVQGVDAVEGSFDFALIAVKAPLHDTVLPPLVERGGVGTFVSMGRTKWRNSSARGTCSPASSSGAARTSGPDTWCATRSAATWWASSTAR